MALAQDYGSDGNPIRAGGRQKWAHSKATRRALIAQGALPTSTFETKGGQGQESHQKEGTWPVFYIQAQVKA